MSDITDPTPQGTATEFALIKRYFQNLSATQQDVLLGIGDDAALLQVTPGKQLVAAVDTLVVGVHFPVNADAANVARRALRVNLSDMAAMAAQPKWFTLALTLPEPDPAWLEGFSRGLAEDAQRFGCQLVGGDTTKGPLSISIQMLGEVEAGKALTRSEAKPGDLIYVSGELGAAAAALTCLDETNPSNLQQQLLDRYYLPLPQVLFAQGLADIAHAAIDISDGLLADVGHIAEASGVGAVIETAKVPLFSGWQQLFSAQQALAWALTGGDDYQLCFTVPPTKQGPLKQLCKATQINAVAIGEIVSGQGVQCLGKDGKPITSTTSQTGYQHF